jgi:complex III assembly factor LYRM7
LALQLTNLAGDVNVLSAAKESIRNGFRDKRSLSASDPNVQASLQHAQEVAQFLRSNVVQGRKDGDVYSQWCPS